MALLAAVTMVAPSWSGVRAASAVSARQLALLRRERFEQYLQEAQAELAKIKPADRHRSATRLAATAMAARSCTGTAATALWRDRLYGPGTAAAGAFDTMAELLAGHFGRLFGLPGLVPDTDWSALGTWVGTLNSPRAGRGERRRLAACFHLLGLARATNLSSSAIGSLGAVGKASEATREGLAKALRDAAVDGELTATVSRLYGLLCQAYAGGRFTDPVFADALIGIAADSAEQLKLAQAFLSRKMRDKAGALAERIVQGKPRDGPTVIGTASVLVQLGRLSEAFNFCLGAEPEVPYPQRREVRLSLFRWLRSNAKRAEQDPPEETTFGVPTLEAEQEEREGAAEWLDDTEARMALADLNASLWRSEPAREIYAEIFSRATDPGLKWAAWLGWAGFEPEGAWDVLSSVEALFTEGNPPASRQTFVETVLATALAGKQIRAGVTWLDAHLSPEEYAEFGPELTAVVAGLWWLLGETGRAEQLGETLKRPAFCYKAVSSIVYMGRGWVRLDNAGNSEVFRYTIGRNLKDELDAAKLWLLAMQLARESVPDLPGSQAPGSTWRLLVTTIPAENPEGTAEHLGALTDACLAWLGKQNGDRLAVSRLLQGAFSPHTKAKLRGPALEEAFRLLEDSLAWAKVQGVPSSSLRYTAKALHQTIPASGASEELTERLRGVLGKHYPDLAAAK